MRFLDRTDAGRQLAARLDKFRRDDPVVLGMPRGGIPVAYEVARALNAPLDVCVVRKIGAPGQPELGLGAVGEGGVTYLNHGLIDAVGTTEAALRATIHAQTAEVDARVRRFRGARPAVPIRGRTVILVDDGIATGGSARAAISVVRAQEPANLILAVPVAALSALEELATFVDDAVCLLVLSDMQSVGSWYEDFSQVQDDEVKALLELSWHPRPTPPVPPAGREIVIPLPSATLRGTLAGPASPSGLVLFAHGSGSSRLSPRNRRVADALHRYGVATLLFDLLTEEEEAVDARTAELRFDIPLLAGRLGEVTDTLDDSGLSALPVGYFGSSTGAAAALIAASQRPRRIAAVVSRGGRPDLAGESLARVRAPTLLIVGSLDTEVIGLNLAAKDQLGGPSRLETVPGATHLFEEPGALDAVARLAGEWFQECFRVASAQPSP